MYKNNDKMSTCQMQVLRLLKFFHNICIEHGIKYTLDAGTLIGAVRERGFIPWDDDGDVTLVRDEYDKLVAVLKKTEFPEDIAVYFPDEKEQFFDFNIRLYCKNVVVRNDDASINQYSGLFSHPTLDIFAMDYVPKSRLKRRLYVLLQQIVFGLAMSKRNNVKINKYRFVEKIGIAILTKIGILFSIKKLCELHEKYSKIYLNERTEYLYCSGWSPEYPGYIYNSKWYEKMHLTKFEDTEFYVADEYDKILTCGYGDWKKPKMTHNHENYVKDL